MVCERCAGGDAEQALPIEKGMSMLRVCLTPTDSEACEQCLPSFDSSSGAVRATLMELYRQWGERSGESLPLLRHSVVADTQCVV